MKYLTPVLILCAGVAHAQSFSPKDTDQQLDRAAMQERVVGRSHEFFDGGVSFFSVSGIYTYTYPDGGRAYGEYELRDDGADGVVCSAFDNGFSRCDMYVDDRARLVLITEDGTRFPVREVR